MRIKSTLFLSIIALLVLAPGCKEDMPFLESDLLVTRQASEDSLKFDVKGESKRITVQSTRDWRIEGIPEWASVDPESGSASTLPVQVTITVPENTGFHRRAELTIDAGISKEHLIIAQSGPEGDDDEIINITCADFSVLPDNDGRLYRLEGTISGSINTQYGNFDVQDATGKVYVYGCVNLSQWVSMIKGGNKITLYGSKDTYNGKVEMKNATIEKIESGSVTPSEIIDISCSAFAALADNDGKLYRLKGTIKGPVNTQYGNFDVQDATGTVYVYGISDIDAWKEKLVEGNAISIYGNKTTYTDKNGNSKIELINGVVESIEAGSTPPAPTPDEPTEFTKASVTSFIAAPVATDKWYELTGVITNIVKTDYGNFYMKDETGEVYVYGLTKSYSTTNDKSFSSIGLKVTDTVTIRTLRSEYNGEPQAGGSTQPAFYVSHKAGPGSGDTPSGITATHPFTNNVTWTLGTSGYEAEVILGNTTCTGFKLGTSSKSGTVTVTVPAGTKKLSFYALGWSNKVGVIQISGGGATQKITAAINAGINNNSPYTVTTLSDSDYFSITFPAPLTAKSDITFTSESDGLRAVVFGINAE